MAATAMAAVEHGRLPAAVVTGRPHHLSRPEPSNPCLMSWVGAHIVPGQQALPRSTYYKLLTKLAMSVEHLNSELDARLHSC